MQNFKTCHKTKCWFKSLASNFLLPGLFICICALKANAQTCPSNIDFESGTFDGWSCYTGITEAIGGQNVITLNNSGGPVGNRHTMYSANPGGEVDPFGGFPVNCPNGSGYSIRLGNSSGGGEAEGISYEFTIPANQNTYTLVYNYAVVFQEPNHQQYQQPRMEIEITNVTDNSTIDCASFTFIPYGSALPGFVQAPSTAGDSARVWYKDWSAVSINLNGNAGKTIRLLFKSADCTFRRHFGYAYIDVNSECSGALVGSTFCPDDTAVNVVAPFGYQSYTWYNSTLTQVLGTEQVLTLRPPPIAGTTIAVKVNPYAGFGCPATFFTKFADTLKVTANAGIDTVSCNRTAVPIGAIPKPGFKYRWSPFAGLSNPDVANPFANPDVSTTYILTTIHDGGGCLDTDTVYVKADVINNSLQLIGSASYCLGGNESSTLRVVQPTDSIQWFKDNVPIRGANQTDYRVTETGLYYAALFNKGGCSINTSTQQINISSVPVARFRPPPSLNQCLVGNQFIFDNTSTNAVGSMQYRWILGNGVEGSARDLTYSYTRSGTYTVKLIVSSNTVCADSSSVTINVFQNAIADFAVNPVCINLPVPVTNNTVDTGSSPVNYNWNFGNGQSSKVRNPPPQMYSRAGSYPVSLSVNTDQCPFPYHTVQRILVIDKPQTGANYPVAYALVNLPLALEARPFGSEILWSPGTSLNNRTSYTPLFTGAVEQLYQVQITTSTGCVTIDTQVVKTVAKVEMYVPNAFSPNNDGKNDLLRPILRGVKEIRYFRVFNRWGQLVYEGRSNSRGWDGTINGIAQQTQTVVWIAEGIGVDGKTYFRKGTSVLVR